MSRKLLIHAGFGKTGTSALQKFFTQNIKRLAARKICYPSAGRNELDAHHYLAVKARPIEGAGFDSDNTWLEYLKLLDDETRSLDRGTVLLSSEIFAGVLKWSKMNNFFDVFSEVSVFLYLRRQDDIVMSSYQQMIKDGIHSLDYEKSDALPFFYDESLARWKDYLKERNGRIIVRPYEKTSFFGKSIFRDFMHYGLGINDLSKYTFPEKGTSNPRLNETALEFKRHLNRICPEHICADLLSSLLDYSASRQSSVNGTWDGSIFPPQKCRKMMAELFEQGNASVAREFLNREDGNLFSDPLPEDDVNWREPHLSEDKLRDIANYLLHLKYPGCAEATVHSLLQEALSAPDPIMATIVMVVWELYGQKISGNPINEPDAVPPRLRAAVNAARQ